MRIVIVLLRKSLLSFGRSKAAVSITFLVPIILIYLFGHVFGLYPKKESGPSGIPLAVVNLSAEPAARDLIDALRAEKSFKLIDTLTGADGHPRPLTEADARQGLHDNAYRFALILPADLLPDDTFGIHVRFLTNPRNEVETQLVTGLLQKTLFSHVPSLLGQSLQKSARRLLGMEKQEGFNRQLATAISDYYGGDKEAIFQRLNSTDGGWGELTRHSAPAAQDPSLRRLDAPTASASGVGETGPAGDLFSRIMRLETEQVSGKETSNPMAARTVGGYAIMFLLMAISGSATTLYEEKNTGIFARLLSSQVRPAHILWARFLFGILLGILQISALFLAGWLFFKIDIWGHLPALAAVTVAAAAACSAFGMLIVAIAPNPHAASGLSTLVVISMSAIGGAWFPVSFMPEMIQRISKFTLVYWAVESFTDVLWAGRTLVELLPKIGILAAIATVISLLAVWLLRRGSMFA